MAIERIDNGDGTTTFKGVDVTIPTTLAKDYDVVAVRRPTSKDKAIIRSDGAVVAPFEHCIERVILTPRPTWKPPASLKPGRYEWNGVSLSDTGFKSEWARNALRDWTDPPKRGLWQVNEDGTATYLGEA